MIEAEAYPVARSELIGWVIDNFPTRSYETSVGDTFLNPTQVKIYQGVMMVECKDGDVVPVHDPLQEAGLHNLPHVTI